MVHETANTMGTRDRTLSNIEYLCQSMRQRLLSVNRQAKAKTALSDEKLAELEERLSKVNSSLAFANICLMED